MKQKLEGIIKLRDRWIVLEDVENPKLQRVLYSRLRKDEFAFFSKGHTDRYIPHSDSYHDGGGVNSSGHTDEGGEHKDTG